MGAGDGGHVLGGVVRNSVLRFGERVGSKALGGPSMSSQVPCLGI